MSANGRLTNSELSSIGNGYYLANNAARSFNAMSAESQRRFGAPIRVVSAYRTIERQRYFWQLYRSGRGNLAAYPGTSNHGLGRAVDLASPADRSRVDQIGARFGWSKRCSDAASEYWHVIYNPTCTGAGPLPPTRARGPNVKELQAYLLRGGYLHKGDRTHPPAIDGKMGPKTKAAIKKFQSEHKLKPDGVAGPKTMAKLRELYKKK
jgi:hypothetical protein